MSISPWGGVQDVERVAKGITFVSTASHGGYRVSISRWREMPRELRDCASTVWAHYAWFEEDCAWAAVVLAFPLEFTKEAGSVEAYQPKHNQAKESLRNWCPEAYERHFQCKLRPEESYILNERQKASRKEH